MDNTLGQKLKQFRKRAGLSQLEIENEINAAPGSISRIESGQINPTKETLLKLASVLELKHIEISGLLGILPFELTTEEITKVQMELQEYLARDVVAYLCDELGNLYGLSNGMKSLLGLTDFEAENLLGRNILLQILNPDSAIGKIMDPQYLGKAVAIVIARQQQEVDTINTEFFAQLARTPRFKLVATELDKITNTDIFSADNKYVHLILGDNKLHYSFSKEVFRPNPRFEITEFINPEPY